MGKKCKICETDTDTSCPVCHEKDNTWPCCNECNTTVAFKQHLKSHAQKTKAYVKKKKEERKQKKSKVVEAPKRKLDLNKPPVPKKVKVISISSESVEEEMGYQPASSGEGDYSGSLSSYSYEPEYSPSSPGYYPSPKYSEEEKPKKKKKGSSSEYLPQSPDLPHWAAQFLSAKAESEEEQEAKDVLETLSEEEKQQKKKKPKFSGPNPDPNPPAFYPPNPKLTPQPPVPQVIPSPPVPKLIPPPPVPKLIPPPPVPNPVKKPEEIIIVKKKKPFPPQDKDFSYHYRQLDVVPSAEELKEVKKKVKKFPRDKFTKTIFSADSGPMVRLMSQTLRFQPNYWINIWKKQKVAAPQFLLGLVIGTFYVKIEREGLPQLVLWGSRMSSSMGTGFENFENVVNLDLSGTKIIRTTLGILFTDLPFSNHHVERAWQILAYDLGLPREDSMLFRHPSIIKNYFIFAAKMVNDREEKLWFSDFMKSVSKYGYELVLRKMYSIALSLSQTRTSLHGPVEFTLSPRKEWEPLHGTLPSATWEEIENLPRTF